MKNTTVTLRLDKKEIGEFGRFYTVLQIRGVNPVVKVGPYGERSFEVRVGDVLTEEQVKKLGFVAELIIRGS